MSDRSTGNAPRGPAWLNRQLVVPGVLALLAAFYLAAATTLRLRGGSGGGFPSNAIGWIQDRLGFEPTFMVAALVMVWCSIWFLTGRFDRPLSRITRIVGLGFCLAVLVGMRGDGVAGGTVGTALAARLTGVLPPWFAGLLVGIAVIAALLLATDFLFFGDFKRLADRAAAPGGARRSAPPIPTPPPGAGEIPRVQSVRTLEPVTTAGARQVEPSDPDESGVEATAIAELESLHLGVSAPDPILAEVDDGAAWFEGEAWAHPQPAPEAPAERPSRGERRRARHAADDEVEADLEVAGPELAAAESDPAEVPQAADFDLFGDPVPSPPASEPDATEPEAAEIAEEFDFEIPFPVPPEDALDAPGTPADAFEDGTDADEPDAESTLAVEPLYTLEPTPPPGLDEELVSDARELVVQFRRASANFLRRRLRVGEVEALALMQELARRGVIECDADAAHGRVRVDR